MVQWCDGGGGGAMVVVGGASHWLTVPGISQQQNVLANCASKHCSDEQCRQIRLADTQQPARQKEREKAMEEGREEEAVSELNQRHWS